MVTGQAVLTAAILVAATYSTDVSSKHLDGGNGPK